MRILVTNDDGIHARGLQLLERVARTLSDDVWVVAPADEMSGAGHSLTISRPLRLREAGPQRYAVSGTPTDCVVMALSLMREAGGPPDLVLSGINAGANLGEDVTYSGTVSAAMEGALIGLRSIALSQVHPARSTGGTFSFAAAEAWAARAIAPLIDAPFPRHTLVNINFPPIAAEAVRGIRVAAQGFRAMARARITERTDPRGNPYYWLNFGEVENAPEPASDLVAVAEGFVAVTPLHLDMTDRPGLGRLAGLYAARAGRGGDDAPSAMR